MIQVFDCEQNTPAWLAARAGIPTASEFATVMAKGKGGGESLTRKKYMLELAGQIITGEVVEGYTNAHMERGKVMEAEARDLYAFTNDAEIKQVGFVRNGDKGCSPDTWVGKDGGAEFKTALPHIQIERLLAKRLPPEHTAQVQGNIWVCEREWWDFCSYWPKLPILVVRVHRDDAYIKNLESEVARFNDELAAVVERIRRYGNAA